MPTGFLIPSWESTMYSWGSTCSTERSVGSMMALAWVMARSTSSRVISLLRPVMLMLPLALMLWICLPEMLT